MANNNILFNAAYSGCVLGLSSRWLPSATSSLRAAASAFATRVDSLIAAGSYDQQQGDLLCSICQGVWKDRIATWTTEADYSAIADAVVSCFTDTLGDLEPVSAASAAIGAVMYHYSEGTAPNWAGGSPFALPSGGAFVLEDPSGVFAINATTGLITYVGADPLTVEVTATLAFKPSTTTVATLTAYVSLNNEGAGDYYPMARFKAGGKGTVDGTADQFRYAAVAMVGKFDLVFGSTLRVLGKAETGAGNAFAEYMSVSLRSV